MHTWTVQIEYYLDQTRTECQLVVQFQKRKQVWSDQDGECSFVVQVLIESRELSTGMQIDCDVVWKQHEHVSTVPGWEKFSLTCMLWCAEPP